MSRPREREQVALKVARARLCNSVEENQRPLTGGARGFGFDMKPFGIVTVRVE